MCHTKMEYTLKSSLDLYLLFENFTTYNYKISYTSMSSIFFILA